MGNELEPIAPLLRDPALTEIMIDGPDAVFVERAGRILLTDRRFDDENHLLNAIGAPTGGTVPGRTRLTPTGIRPHIMDKIHHLGVAAPELVRLYPKNSAGTGVSGRRANAVENQGAFPTRDRRRR